MLNVQSSDGIEYILPSSHDPVLNHLDYAFAAVVESPPRPRALRCSGLPYCPILDAVIPTEPEQGTLSGALYMGIGSIMHQSLQFFATLGPPGASVWGSWKCSKCARQIENTFRPKDCCNLPMLYVEASLRVSCLTGHVDLIARYDKKWILLDFKTTSVNPGKPKREHLLQVRHYVAMLQLQHHITIDAYYIVYIGRSKPIEERWVYGPYNAKGSLSQTKDWIFRAVNGFKAATKVRRGDTSRKSLVELVKNRPCHSRADFDAYMSRRYEFQRKPCPLLNSCSKGNRAAFDAVVESLDTTEDRYK